MSRFKANKAAPIPSDAAAYLTQAAEQIAVEQGFRPQSREEMGQWIHENLVAVATRAKELQTELLYKVVEYMGGEQLKHALTAHAWFILREGKISASGRKDCYFILKR